MSSESTSQRPPDLALSRHALLAEAFETLARGLGPFIDERMMDYFPGETSWAEAAANRMGRPAEHGATDPLFQLLVLRRFWGPVFAGFFGEDLRPLIGQLIETRNFWAHFNLPDDSAYTDRILLSIERLIAPVSPDLVSGVRRLRTRLKNPMSASTVPGEDQDIGPPVPTVDTDALQRQLDESEAVFADLQGQFSDLADELTKSRRAAAAKQARIQAIEEQLNVVHGRSDVLQSYLEQERDSRQRLEWMFVAFITIMMLVMVLIAIS